MLAAWLRRSWKTLSRSRPPRRSVKPAGEWRSPSSPWRSVRTTASSISRTSSSNSGSCHPRHHEDNAQALFDGLGWRPLRSEWDYASAHERIVREVFADECHTPGSPDRAPFFRRFLTICRKLTVSMGRCPRRRGRGGGAFLAFGPDEVLRGGAGGAGDGAGRPLEPEVVVSRVRYTRRGEGIREGRLSFRVGGTVESLHQVEGPDGQMHESTRATVPRGSVLARLDPADYRRDRDEPAESWPRPRPRWPRTRPTPSWRGTISVAARSSSRAGPSARKTWTMRRQALKKDEAAVAAPAATSSRPGSALQQAEANLEYCTLTAALRRGHGRREV